MKSKRKSTKLTLFWLFFQINTLKFKVFFIITYFYNNIHKINAIFIQRNIFNKKNYFYCYLIFFFFLKYYLLTRKILKNITFI